MSETRSTLGDVHNILMDMMERLSDPDCTGEALKEEIQRADAVSELAGNVIQNANVILKAHQIQAKASGAASMPRILTGGER